MKSLNSFRSLVLGASSLILIVSCSKDLDEQPAKQDNMVGQFTPVPCEPFLGIQAKRNVIGIFAIYDGIKQPLCFQPPIVDPFLQNCLLLLKAEGGTPYYRNDWGYLGVTDGWINPGEVLIMKLTGILAGKAANRMNMQLRKAFVTAKADFYLNGVHVGDTAISGGPATQEQQLLVYTAEGAKSDFDEVRFSVTSGYLAITAYTPNHTVTPIPAGQSGFYLVEAPGRSVVARFRQTAQHFTFEHSYNNADLAIQPKVASPGGDFPIPTPGPTRKHWVNIWGSDGVSPAPLGYGSPTQGRLGVTDRFISGTEVVTITPGADFPDGGSSAKMRAVQVSAATLLGSHMLVEVWSGATLVGWGTSSGADNAYVSVIPGKNFDRVTIKAGSGTDLSIGRNVNGPIAATIKLYPACP